MKSYNVYVEINGEMTLVGALNGNNENDTCFAYNSNYVNSDIAKPISISLPLQTEAFSTLKTRNFFEALLPEGFSRQSLANSIHKSENDYIGLLSVVGRECIGSILISEDTYELPSSYDLIDDKTVKALAAEGATKSTELLTKTHLSLAGATGKVGLYRDEKTGNWYLPNGLAASTHIIKQSHVRYNDIVINEALCSSIASKCKIDVPDTFIIDTGGKTDNDILFVTKRFDRYLEKGKVHRLHQEDFGQALSIPANEKYEKDGDAYMTKMFALIKTQFSNPIDDQIKLFRMIAFNIMIGNTDAHLKNYSILYNKNLCDKKLSPAYDLLCTNYHGTTKSLSFNINGKYDIEKVCRNDLVEAAAAAGIKSKISVGVLEELCDDFEKNLAMACDKLVDQGFDKARDIEEAILKSADRILK